MSRSGLLALTGLIVGSLSACGGFAPTRGDRGAPITQAPWPSPSVPVPEGPSLLRAKARWVQSSWNELPGWQADRLGEWWPALVKGCVKPAAGWQKLCDEARRLATPVFYRDYGLITRFRAPGGSLIAVVGGARETALRGLGPIIAAPVLRDELHDLAEDEDQGMEALFQVTGQQGADLSDRLLVARKRG